MNPDPPSSPSPPAPAPKSSSTPAGESESSSHPEFLHGAEGFTPEIPSAPSAYQPVPVPPGPQTIFREKNDGWTASIQSLTVSLVIALFVITFLLQAFQIPSKSMEDTLLIGDYLFVNKVDYGEGGIWRHILPYRRVERGDVIVFRYPVDPSQLFVKRVIAVPGDRVRLLNKQVWINGKPQWEYYAVHYPGMDSFRDNFPLAIRVPQHIEARWWMALGGHVRGGELLVPPRSYFVLGDNRDDSLDSRYWGFVPRENIIGRPLVIYFSLRSPGRGVTPAADDKLRSLGYALTHPWAYVRWQRMLRLVR